MLKEGNNAPLNVELTDANGNAVSLNDLLGKYVVLYFYPANDTPGCTTEACSFRDSNTELESLGVTVVGVSADGANSHQKFSNKLHLNFPLWSDSDRKLIDAFGTWKKTDILSKLTKGIKRMTFVISPEGKIVKVWPKVKPEKHTQEVLELMRLQQN